MFGQVLVEHYFRVLNITDHPFLPESRWNDGRHGTPSIERAILIAYAVTKGIEAIWTGDAFFRLGEQHGFHRF